MLTKNIQRRDFVKSLGIISAMSLGGISTFSLASCKQKTAVNKRDAILSLIENGKNNGYIPSGFFVHFGEKYKFNDAAVDRHLEYFKAIDMDFIKIQYEAEFPHLEQIKRPEDWKDMPLYGKEFYEKQLYIVKELVKKGKNLAPVIATLYSPFMSAGHTAGGDLLTEHMKEDPESVKKGMEIIAESTLLFAKECIKAGVDGFLTSTQGGEASRFADKSIFTSYVKPYDLQVMNVINESCHVNVLHICDYVSGYDDYLPFVDYPGQIVNCSMQLGDKTIDPKYVYDLFKRPVLGGLEKKGAISGKSDERMKAELAPVLKNAPEGFILGAECALLGEIDWKLVRSAVDMAHNFNS